MELASVYSSIRTILISQSAGSVGVPRLTSEVYHGSMHHGWGGEEVFPVETKGSKKIIGLSDELEVTLHMLLQVQAVKHPVHVGLQRGTFCIRSTRVMEPVAVVQTADIPPNHTVKAPIRLYSHPQHSSSSQT